jgi:hypothetical protein
MRYLVVHGTAMLRLGFTDDRGAEYFARPGKFQDRLQFSGRTRDIQLLR